NGLSELVRIYGALRVLPVAPLRQLWHTFGVKQGKVRPICHRYVLQRDLAKKPLNEFHLIGAACMNTFRRDPSSACALALKTVALAAALSASSVVVAAENGNQRYSPGVGGSDMTSPLVPGWYGQVAMVAYHATKIKGNDGKQLSQSGKITQADLLANPVTAGPANFLPQGVNYSGSKIGIKTDTYALLPRITYLSSEQLWGGNVGFTAMLP